MCGAITSHTMPFIKAFHCLIVCVKINTCHLSRDYFFSKYCTYRISEPVTSTYIIIISCCTNNVFAFVIFISIKKLFWDYFWVIFWIIAPSACTCCAPMRMHLYHISAMNVVVMTTLWPQPLRSVHLLPQPHFHLLINTTCVSQQYYHFINDHCLLK